MRLAPPPPNICINAPPLPGRYEHADLLRAVSTALAALDRHETQLTRALELGGIDLPPGAPNAQDQAQLQAAAPLYFASELESAGLLPTAELIAGLFASGTITQPLGPVAQLINAFWRGRRERLDASERSAIFVRVIEAPHFERLMGALCDAIVAQADGSDLRRNVVLASCMQNLGEFLAQRVDAMAALAARDMVENINTALAFLRDRLLQAAFGVNSLWALVAIVGSAQGMARVQGTGTIQAHVDRGRAGQTVLLWLGEHYLDQTPRLDPNRTDNEQVIAAAQRWSSSRLPVAAAPVNPAAPALPIAV